MVLTNETVSRPVGLDLSGQKSSGVRRALTDYRIPGRLLSFDPGFGRGAAVPEAINP